MSHMVIICTNSVHEALDGKGLASYLSVTISTGTHTHVMIYQVTCAYKHISSLTLLLSAPPGSFHQLKQPVTLEELVENRSFVNLYIGIFLNTSVYLCKN